MGYGRFKQKIFAASKISRNLREIISLFISNFPRVKLLAGRRPVIGGKKDNSTEF